MTANTSQNGPAFPVVNVDLSDVTGMPGLPSPTRLARQISAPEQRWRSRSESSLFLESATADAGAFAPLTDELSAGQDVGVRVSSRLTSRAGTQEICQQLLRGVPVVGATYKTVQSERSSVLVGTPTADLAARDPGPRRRRSKAAVLAETRAHLGLDVAAVSIQPVIFPLEGIGVWAYDVRLSDRQSTADIRAYVRESDLSLLYAQDVACAVFAEGRAFAGNPGRSKQAQGVRLRGLQPPDAALSTARLKVEPAAGSAVSRSTWDFRLDPSDEAFDEVSAFHHMQTAADFFGDIVGPDLFTDRPFTPLTVRVRDQRARGFVGLFKPDHDLILLDDAKFSAARSGDICIHEFTHAVVHRMCRLGPFTSAVGRGLNEGFADYAQASVYDDPRFGDWVQQRADGARRCDRADLRLPAGPADTPRDRYRVGEAWSCLLWDLRRSVGPGVADAIAFHGLQFLSPAVDYAAARAALDQADAELFPQRGKGRHRQEIDDAFAARRPG